MAANTNGRRRFHFSHVSQRKPNFVLGKNVDALSHVESVPGNCDLKVLKMKIFLGKFLKHKFVWQSPPFLRDSPEVTVDHVDDRG